LYVPTIKVGEATVHTCPLPSPPPMCVCIFVPSSLGVLGYYLRENFYILYARMCILERTQRRIGIVDEKKRKLLRLNTYGDRNHRERPFCITCPRPRSWGGNSPPAPRLRRPCPTPPGNEVPQRPKLFDSNQQ
jgi:hypothetical protein